MKVLFLPVAANNFESSVVSAQGDVEPDKRLTGLNQFEVGLIDSSLSCSIVEEEPFFVVDRRFHNEQYDTEHDFRAGIKKHYSIRK